MNSYALVYIFLAIAMGAMLYVVGTPWWTPRTRRTAFSEPQKGVTKEKW